MGLKFYCKIKIQTIPNTISETPEQIFRTMWNQSPTKNWGDLHTVQVINRRNFHIDKKLNRKYLKLKGSIKEFN